MQPNHSLDIYERSTDSDGRLAAHVAAGLRAGEAVVVIASVARLGRLAARLQAEGMDLARCRSERQLLEVDSEALHRQLFADGSLASDAFAAMAEEMTSGLGPVRVVGELVDLLWERGDVVGAMALEEEWLQFAKPRGFSLYCCYCADNLGDDEEGLAELQRLHDEVVAAPPRLDWMRCRAVRQFSGASDGPLAARRFTRQTLAEWGLRQEVEDACLIVSELSTNAVLHADGPFEVSLSRRPEVLRIAVGDSSPLVPVALRRPSAMSVTGRGLGIVAGLGREWGAETGATGKTVWVDLPLAAG